MNLQNEIRKAYDSVHAPDALTERLKQELYQQDLRGEADAVGGIVEEAPRRSPFHMLRQGSAFIAASVMLFTGIGIAVWYMRDKAVDFHPGSNVSAPAHETVALPDVTGLSQQEAASRLTALGLVCETSGSGTVVLRTEPAAGTQLASGSTVHLICE